MKRVAVIIFVLCFCVGAALCVPQIRRTVLFNLLILTGQPLDEASAQVPCIGQYKEYSVDDPAYDCLIYYFDGMKGKSLAETASAGVRAIRRGGFKHAKKMTLVIFCDLTAPSKAPDAVYPFGLFLESAVISNRTVAIGQLASRPFIPRPMNWDNRINEWVFTTNNAATGGLEVVENASYTKCTNALDHGWFMNLDDLKNKKQVHGKFGVPKYYVREFGTYSEIYPVEDVDRVQAGTVRIWYNADRVTKTGCYMTNK
jgi:hypothetical protein